MEQEPSMQTKTNKGLVYRCVAEKYLAAIGSDEEIAEESVHNETGKVYVSLY